MAKRALLTSPRPILFFPSAAPSLAGRGAGLFASEEEEPGPAACLVLTSARGTKDIESLTGEARGESVDACIECPQSEP